MSSFFLVLILIALLILLTLFALIKLLLSAKKTLLTEQLGWSAKTIKIKRKKNRIRSLNDERKAGENTFLEEIADQSSDFLKNQ